MPIQVVYLDSDIWYVKELGTPTWDVFPTKIDNWEVDDGCSGHNQQ